MTQKENIRRLLLFALVAVSFGGWLLHLRIHSPFKEAMNLVPFIAGMVGIMVVPALFMAKQTRAYANIL